MSKEVKAHGLDGRLVAPDWPPLTIAELCPLFEGYGQLGPPLGIRFHSPRPLSAAAVVGTARGPVFVKRHARTVRDRAGLMEEHYLLAHLYAAGAPVARVLRNDAGESAVETGRWTYEVHDHARGEDLYADAISWTPFSCRAHAFEAGRSLALLHQAAEGFGAPPRKVQPLVAGFTIFAAKDPVAAMKEYLNARPALCNHAGVRTAAEQALELLAPFHAGLLPLLPHLEPLWTHNDLHGSNLLWEGSGEHARATAVIDFGLADRTNAVHDLAHAIERSMVGWLALVEHPDRPDEAPIYLDHLEALLAGYESVRALTREEATALAPMTALCHAEFALTEADYFLAVLNSEESAGMAYDGYLVGHARWFSSRQGGRLLDALRCWTDARRICS
jgi:Ser/Thr protein kinase RdoA (MazF antagonist)